MLPLLSDISDNVEREAYVQEIALQLGSKRTLSAWTGYAQKNAHNHFTDKYSTRESQTNNKPRVIYRPIYSLY